MKKLGFTLAEVLLTLGIVGVIAAITMPALQANIQRQTVGPALAKAINTLESANKMLLSKENARNLTEVCTDDNSNYLDCLVNNNVLKATTVPNFSAVKNFQLSSFFSINNDNSVKYALEDGLDLYAFNNPRLDGVVNQRFYSTNYSVFVDINGPKQPNALGRDVFRLNVNAGGDVLAYGSDEHRVAMPRDNSWRGRCDANGVTDANTCAGSVVDNGYRVIYPF